MRAALFRAFGNIDQLQVEDIPSPVPEKGQVVVSVKAAGVAYPDVLIAQDKYQNKPELPYSPGGEVSGIVKLVGEGVTRFKPGDAVIARPGSNGCREEVVVPQGVVWPMPAGLDFNVAAGFGSNYFTSYYALRDRGQLKPGETLLVLGASGGVGLAAVDIGKMMGARVIACASSDEKLDICRQAGADELVNYEKEDLRDAIKRLTDGKGVDMVYDPVGDKYAEPAVRGMAWNGRYLVIGFAAGAIPKIALNLVLLKGCAIVGVLAGAHGMRDPKHYRSIIGELLELIHAGKLHPLISATYPLKRTADALNAMLKRQAVGKVVVTI